MTLKMTFAIGVAVVAAVANDAAAQDLAPLRLSLDEARMRAVSVSHRLAEARARAAAAGECGVDDLRNWIASRIAKAG